MGAFFCLLVWREDYLGSFFVLGGVLGLCRGTTTTYGKDVLAFFHEWWRGYFKGRVDGRGECGCLSRAWIVKGSVDCEGKSEGRYGKGTLMVWGEMGYWLDDHLGGGFSGFFPHGEVLVH